MSKTTRLFQKMPVEIPNRSGFDMSHLNVGTMKVGTLVPVLVEPVYPNDILSLGVNASVQLPPMASDFIGKVDLKLEAFFCPNRILWQGWKKFVNMRNVDQNATIVDRLPKIVLPNQADANMDYIGPGTLADYLGVKLLSQDESYITGDHIIINNPLPFLAYAKIYDSWYRDKVVQKSLFFTPDEFDNMSNGALYQGATKEEFAAGLMPYWFGPDGLNSSYMVKSSTVSGRVSDFDWTAFYQFADESTLFDLRQRNWAKDYFTSATPKPQAGDPVSLEFGVDMQGETASFSIAALRAANSLQKFVERRNIAGSEYQDQINVDWGIMPSDAITQHPIYLGSQSVPVYNHTVAQTANGSLAGNERNPFSKTVGASFGKSQAFSNGSLLDSFKATEHGFLMVIASIVPHAFYATGTRKYLMYNEFGDFPVPALAGVGDQAIAVGEIQDTQDFYSTDTFGYTNRFAEAKYHGDEVHGLLRDGESLEHFAVQRSFRREGSNSLKIGSDFIKIKDTAMDNVTAVATTLSQYGCWYEMYFNFRKSAVLPAYSIPTLGDEKNTHTEMVDKGGKRL